MNTITILCECGAHCRHRLRMKASPVNVAASAVGKMMAYAASALLLLTLWAVPAHAALTEVAAILNLLFCMMACLCVKREKPICNSESKFKTKPTIR